MENPNMWERVGQERDLCYFLALEAQSVDLESCQGVLDFGWVAERTC